MIKIQLTSQEITKLLDTIQQMFPSVDLKAMETFFKDLQLQTPTGSLIVKRLPGTPNELEVDITFLPN